MVLIALLGVAVLAGCEVHPVSGTLDARATLRLDLDCSGAVQVVTDDANDWGGIAPSRVEAEYCVPSGGPGGATPVTAGEFQLFSEEGDLFGTISGTVEPTAPEEGEGPLLHLVWTITDGTLRYRDATGTLRFEGSSGFAGVGVTGTISGDIVVP